MSSYTISKLASEAGVSTHIVRDHVLRGLLRPSRRTRGGYGVFDAGALARLRFVRSAFAAGISLDELRRFCHALDNGHCEADECLAGLQAHVATRRNVLAAVDCYLAGIAASMPSHANRREPS